MQKASQPMVRLGKGKEKKKDRQKWLRGCVSNPLLLGNDKCLMVSLGKRFIQRQRRVEDCWDKNISNTSLATNTLILGGFVNLNCWENIIDAMQSNNHDYDRHASSCVQHQKQILPLADSETSSPAMHEIIFDPVRSTTRRYNTIISSIL